MFDNFVRHCLTKGSIIRPLNIPLDDKVYIGTCNPSIFFDGDRLRMIIRRVNYALWNSDNQYRFTTQYGPLWYISGDDERKLMTKNYLCELKDNVLIHKLINTSKFDKKPLWEFVGLEDARLVRWNGKLYGTGVRRDTTTNGQGRMELSELDEDGNEISRVRIKAPGEDKSYCEKNWMPILDMPYHYVKWCNPVEVVKVNPETGDSETVVLKEQPQDLEYYNTNNMGIRGSSQVIPWGDYRIAITHMCELWINEKKQKCGTGYFEQFIVWDKDWNIVKLSEPFRFAGFGIEFTNGLAYKDGYFYIPFALQDNFSFLLTVDENTVSDFIFNNDKTPGDYIINGSTTLRFFDNPYDSYNCMEMGNSYFNQGFYAPSMVLYERACEYNTFKTQDELYDCMYLCGKSIANHGKNDDAEILLWNKMIDLDMNRSEGYLMASKYYSWRARYSEAYMFAKLAYQINNFNMKLPDEVKYLTLNEVDSEIQYIATKYNTNEYLDCLPMAEKLRNTGTLNSSQMNEIDYYINIYKNNKKNKERIL